MAGFGWGDWGGYFSDKYRMPIWHTSEDVK